MLIIVIGSVGLNVKVWLGQTIAIMMVNKVAMCYGKSVGTLARVVRASYYDAYMNTALAQAREAKFVRGGSCHGLERLL